MGLDLYVIRHAVAAEAAEFAGSDADRPLTDEGREKFKAIAAVLSCFAEPPRHIWTSPLLRARQTAEILAKALVGVHVKETDLLACGAKPKKVLDLAAVAGDEPAVVVGHAPDMGELIAHAIGSTAPLPLQKGAVAGLYFDDEVKAGRAELFFWLTTGDARRLAGKRK